MCNSCFRVNSLTTNNFKKYSFQINIAQISINSCIIFINILIFIIRDKALTIKTGFIYYINNIFISLIIISLFTLIEFYRKRNILTNEKKQASLILICFCLFLSSYKCLSSLLEISKVFNIYRLFKQYNSLFTQFKIMLVINLMTLVLYFLSTNMSIIYCLLMNKLRVVVFNNNLNNVYHNNGNISYMSTKLDANDNSQEIIINNLNEGNKKNNNFFFFSQNLINKFEKEFEDKETQTTIKGNI